MLNLKSKNQGFRATIFMSCFSPTKLRNAVYDFHCQIKIFSKFKYSRFQTQRSLNVKNYPFQMINR